MSESKSPVSGSRGVSRVLRKLDASIQSENYYEAHQMYRTLYFRYLAQKKYEELLDLLYKGALIFLNKDQLSSGADLSILIVEVLEEAEVSDQEIWMHRLGILINKIGPNIVERESLLVSIILRYYQIQ